MPCHIVQLFPLLRSPHSGSRVLRLTPSRRAQLAEAPQQLAAVAPWRPAVERSFGGEPSLAAQQLSAALITAAAIVTRTISLAVEAPTTEVVAQSSGAALLLAESPYVEVALPLAEPPYVEVARVVPAAE
jgi:hypothetical protein